MKTPPNLNRECSQQAAGSPIWHTRPTDLVRGSNKIRTQPACFAERTESLPYCKLHWSCTKLVLLRLHRVGLVSCGRTLHTAVCDEGCLAFFLRSTMRKTSNLQYPARASRSLASNTDVIVLCGHAAFTHQSPAVFPVQSSSSIYRFARRFASDAKSVRPTSY